MKFEAENFMKDFLHAFKIALIEEDIESLNKLTNELDELLQKNLSLNELKQLKALIKEASKLTLSKKNELAPSIQKLKLAQKFF